MLFYCRWKITPSAVMATSLSRLLVFPLSVYQVDACLFVEPIPTHWPSCVFLVGLSNVHRLLILTLSDFTEGFV
jgi:hypothetical protein